MTAEIGIDGILVGHSTDAAAGTGCTVVLAGHGVVASYDVRGGAPGTRETDLLSPYASVSEVHGVLLTGGSAFGLAAADGVVRFLEEQGHGYPTPYCRVPLVPGAVIYDLGLGHAHGRPRPEDGYGAAASASSVVEEGSVGVGTGATVGKVLGEDGWMKGGFGVASVALAGGATVTALSVVNAFGDVLAEDGTILAGALKGDLDPGEGPRSVGAGPGRFLDTEAYLQRITDHPRFNSRVEHTTLSVVVTDARLDKTQCGQVARMGHDGFARALRPVHTPVDGDTVFMLSTGRREAHVFLVGCAAALAVERSIRRGVRLAAGLHGVPAVQDQ